MNRLLTVLIASYVGYHVGKCLNTQNDGVNILVGAGIAALTTEFLDTEKLIK